MDISLALKNPGQVYPFDRTLSVAPMVVLDDPVSFESVRIEGTYSGAGESVAIEGAITCQVASRCAMCLEPVSVPLAAKVDEIFVRESSDTDPDRYRLDGSKVDLEPMVREALLLEMPMRLICREDCRGLCPSCGANMNIAPCTCQEGGERHNPFSALSELLTKDEEV